jgi:hypothetical protein
MIAMKLFQTLFLIAVLSHPWGDSNSMDLVSRYSRVILNNTSEYSNVQECVNAAAVLSPPGSCTVSAGFPNTAEIEMATGVKVLFAKGIFVNSSKQGGQSSFIHFAHNVRNASVCGEGSAKTVLENSSAGPQFGAVVQDEGTGNLVCDLTLNGNGNTTDTLLDLLTTRSMIRNATLIGDFVQQRNHAYTWDIRGATDCDAADVEVIGGSLDGIQLTTKDFNGTYGNIDGGHFENVYVRDSPRNGVDFNANGAHFSISGTLWINLRVENNGSINDGTDDEYGLNLFATEAGDNTVADNVFIRVSARGNTGSGIRLKGNVTRNVFIDTASLRNGKGRGGTVQRDSIQLLGELGSAIPRDNWIEGSSRGNKGTLALRADPGTAANVFILNVGADPVISGDQNDFYTSPNKGGPRF